MGKKDYTDKDFEEFCDRIRALIPVEEIEKMNRKRNAPRTLLVIPKKKKTGDKILELVYSIKREIR